MAHEKEKNSEDYIIAEENIYFAGKIKLIVFLLRLSNKFANMVSMFKNIRDDFQKSRY